jgi:hypothetical protein
MELEILRILSDIANYIYEHPKALDLNLQGIWIADRESSITSKISAENSDPLYFQLPSPGTSFKSKFLRWTLSINMNMYLLSSRYHHPLLEKQTDISAVNRSWHTSTRWQLIANTRAMWRNM